MAPCTQAVAVFAKAPVPGQVKTRLSPAVTPDEAASLHGSLVMDMLERCQSLKGCDRILVGAPSREHPFFRAMEARYKVKLWEQKGKDLGARMQYAVEEGVARGYESIVIVGTDIPEVSADILIQALQAVKNHDVVLGPTFDGGYYLIALRKAIPELFAGIPWSTDQVFPLTMDKAKAGGYAVHTLPCLRDVDTIEDLHHIIQKTKSPNQRLCSARTKNVLQELGTRLGKRQ